MQKKYIVRLTDEERDILRSVVKKLKGSSQKVRRAQMLLKADANWSLRLLAEKVVELEIVESISHETVRRTLKKTA